MATTIQDAGLFLQFDDNDGRTMFPKACEILKGGNSVSLIAGDRNYTVNLTDVSISSVATVGDLNTLIEDLCLDMFYDPYLVAAKREIYNTYGKYVSIYKKSKSLHKFGRTLGLGTIKEQVWYQGGTETLETGNLIDSLISDDASDTQEVIIEGHTISGDQLTFVTQTLTLNGTTQIPLTTNLYRASRIYNNGSTDFAGTVTVYKNAGTVVHLSTDGAGNQSLKCATSISNVDFWIVNQVIPKIGRQNTRSVDFQLQVREYGKTFRDRFPFFGHSYSASLPIDLDTPLVIPSNADIRVMATSSGTGTTAGCSIVGPLAIVIGTL